MWRITLSCNRWFGKPDKGTLWSLSNIKKTTETAQHEMICCDFNKFNRQGTPPELDNTPISSLQRSSHLYDSDMRV